jgi:putative PEP-CTERM system TPR-repeat lipoprotein
MPRLSAIVCVISVLAAGCGGKTAEDYLRSAEQQIAQGNRRGAEIELLNAVKLAPSDAAAHRARGANRLALNQPALAETDLRRALQLGESPQAILPALLRALLAQGKSNQLLSEFAATPALAAAGAEADVRSAIGDAHLAESQVDAARAAFQAALAAAAGNVQARLGLARIEAAAGRFDGALSAVDAVIAESDAADAHFVKAILLRLRGDGQGSRRSLERALVVSPDHLRSRIELVSQAIDAGDHDRAGALLSAPGAQSGADDARIEFLKAKLDARRGMLAEARTRIAAVLRAQPDNAAGNLLAGQIEFQDGKLANAESFLRKTLIAQHRQRDARHLLAVVHLRQGSPAKAIDVLQPLLEPGATQYLATLRLAGEAHLQHGELRKAAALFEAARGAKGGDAYALFRLGQIALTRGRFDDGVQALEDAAGADQAVEQADAALVALHLYRNDQDKALAAAEAFKARHPKNWLAHLLAGRVRLARGELSPARRQFETALALRADAPAALAGLAEVDLLEGKPELAVRRYEASLQRQPDEQSYLALAEFRRRTSDHTEDATDVLRQGAAAVGKSAVLHVALVRRLVELQEFQEAITLARKFADANAGEPAALDALVDAQLGAGQIDEAVRTLERISLLDAASPRPWQRVAGAQMARRDPDGAIATLKRAQLRAPQDMSVLADLTQLQLASGALARAAEGARKLQSREAYRATGAIIAGDVHLAARQPAEAERSYREALQAEPRNADAAVKLCRLLAQTTRSAECAELSARWLAANPGDVPMRLHLAERALAAGHLKEAVRHWEAVIAREPTHVLALNNAAWALGRLGDPRALALAQRAGRLAPRNPDVLNTLGMLQLERGDATKGAELLALAHMLAPQRPDLKLHHAKGLLKTRRVEEARVVLVALAAEALNFEGRDEVAPLLKSLPPRP